MPAINPIYPSVQSPPTSITNGVDNDGAAILAKLLTVDGAESGLDADKVDGQQASDLLARANHTGPENGVYYSAEYCTPNGIDNLAQLHVLRDLAPTGSTIKLGPLGAVYRVSAPLTLSVGGQIWDCSAVTIMATDDFSGSQIVNCSSTSGGEIIRPTIDGNGKAADLLRLASNWRVDRPDLSNGTEYGITGASCSNVTIIEPKVREVGKYHLRIQNFGSGTMDNIKVYDPDFDLTDQGVSSTQVAILCRGENDANPITGLRIFDGEIDLVSEPTASGHLGIELRYVKGGRIAGVEVNGGAMHTSLAAADSCVVTGCVANGQNYYAFEIASPLVGDTTQNNTVTSNSIDGQGLLRSGYAVQGLGPNKNNTIGGGSIRGVVDNGVYVHSTVTDLTCLPIDMDLDGADYAYYLNDPDGVSLHLGNIHGRGTCLKGVYAVNANNVSVVGGVINGMTENDIYLNHASGTMNDWAISGTVCKSSIGANNHIAHGGAGTLGSKVVATGISGVFSDSSSYRVVEIYDLSANIKKVMGAGSPEGNVTAGVGSEYIRTDGGASTTKYFKESGTGNTGWVAK